MPTDTTIEKLKAQVAQLERALAARTSAHFHQIVDALPQLVAYTDRELRYQFVNQQYQKLFNVDPDQIIGRRLPDVIGPAAWEQARPHVEKALTGRRVDYQQCYNYSGGKTRYIEGHLLPDIDDSGSVRGYWAVLNDVTRFHEAQQRIRDSEAHYRALFSHMDSGVIFYQAVDDGMDFVFDDINDAALHMIRRRRDELIGQRVADLFPEAELNGLMEIYRRVWRSGETESIGPILYDDGDLHLWIEKTVSKMPAGEIFAVFKNVSERVQAEENARRLMAELDHRVKNNLATVLALMDQTLNTCNDLESFGVSFQGRIRAMAAAHDTLARQRWTRCDLRGVVEGVMKPFALEVTKVTMDGPDLRLPPSFALPLGLTLHELATNAIKHGALSVSQGTVEINWQLEQNRLVLAWAESGATCEPGALQSGNGLGLILIRGLIEHQLDGTLNFSVTENGICCTLCLPVHDQSERKNEQNLATKDGQI
jgi:PAS domain S-box-containing protein